LGGLDQSLPNEALTAIKVLKLGFQRFTFIHIAIVGQQSLQPGFNPEIAFEVSRKGQAY
jgi:hypothetical protein